MKAEIEVSGLRHGKVVLDGVDVSKGTASFTLAGHVGEIPRLTLDLLLIEASSAWGEAVEVFIPPATRDALIALGWMPPGPGADDPQRSVLLSAAIVWRQSDYAGDEVEVSMYERALADAVDAFLASRHTLRVSAEERSDDPSNPSKIAEVS